MQAAAKIFATILGFLVLSRAYTDYKAKKESLIMMVFWTLTWVAILSIAYYPDLVRRLMDLFGGERTGLGTVFGMGLAFVLYVSYRVYTKANRIEKALGKLARRLAIGSAEGKKTRSGKK